MMPPPSVANTPPGTTPATPSPLPTDAKPPESTPTEPEKPAATEPPVAIDARGLLDLLIAAKADGTFDALRKKTFVVSGTIAAIHPNLHGPLKKAVGEVILEGMAFDPMSGSVNTDLTCEMRDRTALKGLRVNQKVVLEGTVRSSFSMVTFAVDKVVSSETPPETASPEAAILSDEEVEKTYQAADAAKKKLDAMQIFSNDSKGLMSTDLKPKRFTEDGKIAPEVAADLLQMRPLRQIGVEGKIVKETLSELAAFSELEVLSISGSGATDDAALAELVRFPNLQVLKLANLGPVTPQGIATFRKLGVLRELEAIGLLNVAEWMNDAAAAELRGLNQLRRLDLRQTAVTDEGLGFLEGLPSLRKLRLADNRGLTGVGLKALPPGTPLLNLDAGRSGFNDEGLATIRRIKSLEGLFIERTAITDAGAEALADLTNLKILEVGETALTNAAIPHILKLRDLRVLDLRVAEMDDASVEALLKDPPPKLGLLKLGSKVTADGARKAAAIKSLKLLGLPRGLPDEANLKMEIKKNNPHLSSVY
jgi:hypothetical protein